LATWQAYIVKVGLGLSDVRACILSTTPGR